MSTLVSYGESHPSVVTPRLRSSGPDPLSLRQLLGVVWGRAKVGAIAGALVFTLVFVTAAQQAPTYYSSATVLIEPKRESLAKPVRRNDPIMPDESAVDTQVEILRSSAVAEGVVRALNLQQDPEFKPRASFLGGEPDPSTVIARTTEGVQRRMHIRRVGMTQVVQVGFVSGSPKKAQRIADAIIASYMAVQMKSKREDIERANAELTVNVENLRKEAADAQAALAQYKVDHGLLSAEGSTLAEKEVSTLNTEIASAKADAAERRARLQAAMDQVRRGSGGADVGAALGSNTIKDLRAREAETSTKLAQLQSRFNDNYPEVETTKAQLADIRSQIQLELNRIMSSLGADAQAASQREASLLGSRAVAAGGLAANGQAQVGLVALEQRADAAKSIYEGYLGRAKELAVEASLQQPDATVTNSAVLPQSPSTPNLKMAAAFALLMGLVAGAVAMIITELWDRRIRSRSDVENKLGVPFAGVLPDFNTLDATRKLTSAARPEPSGYLVANPYTDFAESFRSLSAFLKLNMRGESAKIIALTSAVPKEGKSITSFCLARTLAMSGSSVVLVDGDLRQRGVTKLAGKATIGIAEVCLGKATLDEALVCDGVSGAWVLPASPNNVPLDLFSRPEAEALLKELAERFDYVIVDTPPVLGVADGRILCAMADSVLYVALWNKTPARMMQSALDILEESGANVVGSVLSKVDIRQQSRYGFGDSSDYFKYYRDYYATAA